MKLIVSVSIALEKKGKFLIIKRAEGDSFPGLWEFPSGRIELGETLEKTAKREVFEETGLSLSKIEYVAYSERFPSGKHCLIHHFYSNSFSRKIKLSHEHSDFRWVSKKEILKMKPLKEIGNDTLKFFELKE